MDLPYHCQQLEFMQSLASHRLDFLNPIFRLFHYVDSIYFVLILVPLVWVGFSYRWGIRLFYGFLLNSMLNYFAKSVFCWPRPSTDLPEIGMFHLSSYGFPSGGAQTALFIGGLIIYYWKNRWAWPVGLSYILLFSFTRLYLGVHYPIDILGGWVIGLVLLFLFIHCIDPIERFLHRKGLNFSFILSEALPLALLLVTKKSVYQRYDAMAIGLGVYLSLKYGLYLKAPKTVAIGLLRGSIAVAGIYVCFFVTKALPHPISYGMTTLWLCLFASPVVKWVIRKP